MDFTKAIVTIRGTAPYSQSHKHDDPWLEGETPENYDKRTWPSKMTVDNVDGKKCLILPAFGVHMSLVEAAKYSKRQIPGQGKATWTAKLRSGISILGPIPFHDVNPDKVESVVLNMHADGRRGSGKRVLRRLPQIPMGWSATFEALILDPILTEPIFTEMVELAGLFIGVGQFRPENGGSNGRFIIEKMEWADNRMKVKKAA